MEGLNAVYNSLVEAIPSCYINKNKNQWILDNPTINVINLEQLGGNSVKLTLQSKDLGILLNRVGNMANKYKLTIEELETVEIEEHTADAQYDYIVCTVSQTIYDGALPVSTVSTSISNLITLSGEEFLMESFRPPKGAYFNGEMVSIKISTKDDSTRTRLNEIKKQVLELIVSNNRKFDIIYDSKVQGYYKLIEPPRMISINEYDNLQSIEISLRGYYLVNYATA